MVHIAAWYGAQKTAYCCLRIEWRSHARLCPWGFLEPPFRSNDQRGQSGGEQALRLYRLLDPGFVGSTQVDLVSAAGLRVLEVETHKSSAELLGVHWDLDQHQTRITNSRFWKVRSGLKAPQHRKSCNGKSEEVTIGHCTFLAHVQRAALASEEAWSLVTSTCGSREVRRTVCVSVGEVRVGGTRERGGVAR